MKGTGVASGKRSERDSTNGKAVDVFIYINKIIDFFFFFGMQETWLCLSESSWNWESTRKVTDPLIGLLINQLEGTDLDLHRKFKYSNIIFNLKLINLKFNFYQQNSL